MTGHPRHFLQFILGYGVAAGDQSPAAVYSQHSRTAHSRK